ncbi:PAQR family membrane homeostasis protein TrhA [Actinomadura sp. HBU206391]|uniref:PAQR family membrane homeostasis protein TrhA n=1 Tax=Actinomadura sp. HBU206391 TaxID=2731692 RepID=UPI0016503110|nr:hemolysin III family protein [Actinomadura sp. HBU206391]MBC6463271.1 hemolysin III family protein [Actinomadura sp. HBU206391]
MTVTTTTATTTGALDRRSVKPKLRGWLHMGAFPAVVVAGLVLVALGPTPQARIAAAIYAATSALLFGVSGTYHRGRSSGPMTEVLRRVDHANIYLIIAGTYTPFAALALEGTAQAVVLSVIWFGALAGVIFRTIWLGAPRWLYTSLYIGLGWVAVFFIPQFASGAGVAATVLVITGGALYSVGGVVYGLRRPDPSPRWFGFHEVFHACTLAAYIAQFVAVSLVVHQAG